MKLNTDSIRRGLKESLPEIDHAGAKLHQRVPYTFVPPSHAKSLDPESSLIEGIRGSGKSFWWAALLSAEHRQFVSDAFPDAHISGAVEIAQGFGDGSGSPDTPSKDVISAIAKKYPERSIWRTLVAEKGQFAGGTPVS